MYQAILSGGPGLCIHGESPRIASLPPLQLSGILLVTDLDAFADIHRELMEAGRRARAERVLPRLLLEVAARLPVADLAEAIMATEDAHGLNPGADAPLRRAALMIRLLPVAQRGVQ